MSDTSEIRIPPRGTRGLAIPGEKVLWALFKPLMNLQLSRYRNAKGPEQAKTMGVPALLLTTIGSKTGKERTALLGGFPDGNDAWLIVGSKGGAATHPAWFINLAKHPDRVWAQVGNRRMKVNVQSLQGTEREQAFARVVAVAPQYEGYLKKTDREIPVVRLTPAL